MWCGVGFFENVGCGVGFSKTLTSNGKAIRNKENSQCHDSAKRAARAISISSDGSSLFLWPNGKLAMVRAVRIKRPDP